MMLFKYTNAENDQDIYISPDQIVAVAKDFSIVNRDDVTGILTVPGTYHKVIGTCDDVANTLVAKTATSTP